MRTSAVARLGAFCVAASVAMLLHACARRGPETSGAAASVPLATPPGITLQVLHRADGYYNRTEEVVLADARGRTLYTYAADAQRGRSTCIAECAQQWPPSAAVHAAEGASQWSAVKGSTGALQWSYRGAPLYTFAGDKAIGDATGAGAAGGAWQVAVLQPGLGLNHPDDISVADVPDAGGVALVDSAGMTLYAFDGDAEHPRPACRIEADCTRHWLPLQAAEIARPGGDFSIIARPDGIAQWAYRGRPLYKFDADQKPSQARGIGIDEHFRVALVLRYFMPADAAVHRLAGLGAVLVTTSGATLYQRDRVQPNEDNHDFRLDHGPPALGRAFGTSTCDANCAHNWPPYRAPAAALPCGYWDVLVRPDGTRQWAYKGFALYTYAADTRGEARGNETYVLAQVDDAGRARLASDAVPAARLGATGSGVDIRVVAGGDAMGIGVSALFWHAVVP